MAPNNGRSAYDAIDVSEPMSEREMLEAMGIKGDTLGDAAIAATRQAIENGLSPVSAGAFVRTQIREQQGNLNDVARPLF